MPPILGGSVETGTAESGETGPGTYVQPDQSAHRRIHRIYRQADVFICPSQKHEAFGLVNVEAMSSGLPVIASDLGGIKEVVLHNRNGLLVRRYREPQAFADAIVRLMHNENLVRQLKRQARLDCLARFSWSATAQRLSRIYSCR